MDDMSIPGLPKASGEVDPRQVTMEILQYCNIRREKQDVNGTGSYMKKKSGTGGFGGRMLSQENRIRLGTYGFRNKNTDTKAVRKSENNINNLAAMLNKNSLEVIEQLKLRKTQYDTPYQTSSKNMLVNEDSTLDVTEMNEAPGVHSINLGMQSTDSTA